MNPARWQRLMEAWGLAPSGEVYDSLATAYSEPHRRYHDGRHIDDCLAQLDSAAGLAESPQEVELALWFHDVVYEPTSSTNELESAERAVAFLRAAGAEGARSRRVHDHILATRHGDQALRGDAAVVVDVDLSILGRDPGTYDAFEQAIREEYRWVPSPIFRRKRAEILSKFLARPRIYATELFRARFEATARKNLERAIRVLGGAG